MSKPFMFSVEMLHEMTGNNRQYLSKKIKRMVDDPNIRLKAVLKSNREGYQISEEEVLRCFDKVTSEQIAQYKEHYLSESRHLKARMLTREEPERALFLKDEYALLYDWKIRMAATAPNRKDTPEMRAYLEGELKKILEMRSEKCEELNRLVQACDETIAQIQQVLGNLDGASET